MFPPTTSRKGIAARASRPDLPNPIVISRETTVPKATPQRGNIPKPSSLKPNTPNPNASPSKLLSTLPWPPKQKQSQLPKPSLQAQHWLAPRAPVRILQRPTISRPTPLVAEGIDGAEAILPRPLVAEETAVPGAQVVSALVPRVDAGTRIDPRTQAEAQISNPGSDSASTTLSQIIRAAGIMHLDLSTTVTETEKTKRSGLRRWKFNPPSRLPRARSNKKALSARNEAFKRFKAQMDQEKEEYDLKLWREGGKGRKRDLRVLEWLEGIPAEAEREFEEGVL
ncbi:hypothetical protein G7Y79_00016g040520 [Physcia stellaris]|nr:hypothetical protein G7Y79_00016g040520 [Physcia stellaris]